MTFVSKSLIEGERKKENLLPCARCLLPTEGTL